jgi:Putative peptidoglycan binding domain/Sel1 repeat
MYTNGQGVPQNDAEAAKWYQRAAEQGLVTAQTMLGVMYHKGQGIPQNDAQAARWYRRAAEQGHADAQYNLGLMYRQGRGVPQNDAEAYFWFNLAAAGDSSAMRETAVHNRDLAAARLTSTQRVKVQSRASRWEPKSEQARFDQLERELSEALSPEKYSKPETHTTVPTTQAIAPVMPVSTSAPLAPSDIRRALVRQVQERLQAAGFSPGLINGEMGAQTRDALRWFQNSKGLLATGDIDEKTLDALGVR